MFFQKRLIKLFPYHSVLLSRRTSTTHTPKVPRNTDSISTQSSLILLQLRQRLVDLQRSTSSLTRTIVSGNVSTHSNINLLLAIPTVGGLEDDNYGIKCRFGRFGTSAATYINKTHILCLTPNIQDDPADISEEVVQVTVAMNGVDFNDEYSEVSFIFIGTGGSISILVIIMGTLIFGLLIISVLIFLGGLQEFIKQRSREDIPRNSYTQVNERGNLGPAM